MNIYFHSFLQWHEQIVMVDLGFSVVPPASASECGSTASSAVDEDWILLDPAMTSGKSDTVGINKRNNGILKKSSESFRYWRPSHSTDRSDFDSTQLSDDDCVVVTGRTVKNGVEEIEYEYVPPEDTNLLDGSDCDTSSVVMGSCSYYSDYYEDEYIRKAVILREFSTCVSSFPEHVRELMSVSNTKSVCFMLFYNFYLLLMSIFYLECNECSDRYDVAALDDSTAYSTTTSATKNSLPLAVDNNISLRQLTINTDISPSCSTACCLSFYVSNPQKPSTPSKDRPRGSCYHAERSPALILLKLKRILQKLFLVANGCYTRKSKFCDNGNVACLPRCCSCPCMCFADAKNSKSHASKMMLTELQNAAVKMNVLFRRIDRLDVRKTTSFYTNCLTI